MSQRICSLLALVLLVGACANVQSADDRLKPLVGADEAALIAGMGRAPDATLDPAPGVKHLQWKRETSLALPNSLLAYQYSGNATRPIVPGNTGIVAQTCVAEWTVEQGVATTYRWQGQGCPSGPILH